MFDSRIELCNQTIVNLYKLLPQILIKYFAECSEQKPGEHDTEACSAELTEVKTIC